MVFLVRDPSNDQEAYRSFEIEKALLNNYLRRELIDAEMKVRQLVSMA